MIRRRDALGWALLAAVPLLASPAAAEPQDAQAEKALHLALEGDYLETRFDDALLKLKAAIKACGREGCSRGMLARLHSALGSVLAGGKKELEDARDEFVAALLLDPTIEPNPDISSAAVTFSFEQAQKKLKIKAPAPSGKPPEGPGSAGGTGTGTQTGPVAPPGQPPTKLPPTPAPKVRRNWISLSFMPDLAVLSGENVCTVDVRKEQHFVCLRDTGTRYLGTPTKDNGDNIIPGIGLATLRLLLGYDRLIGDSITLGARIGAAFGGASGSGIGFIPFHAEGRFAYWPLGQSFAGPGVRPFFSVSGGLAQVDTKVQVEVLEDGEACGAMDPTNSKSPCTVKVSGATGPNGAELRKQTLTVFKQAGTGFAAFGAGIQFAPVTNFGINIGICGGLTFPVVIPVISPEIGLSLGF